MASGGCVLRLGGDQRQSARRRPRSGSVRRGALVGAGGGVRARLADGPRHDSPPRTHRHVHGRGSRGAPGGRAPPRRHLGLAARPSTRLMEGDLVAVFRNDMYPTYPSTRPRPRHPSSLAWSSSQKWATSSQDAEQGRAGPAAGRRGGQCSDVHWMETAEQYCQSSSLHGLRYVGDAHISPIERVFWVVSFALAVIVAAYFITNIYQRWEHSPVINSIAPAATPIFDIPFPALTICNMNRARRSIAEIIKLGSPRNPYNALQRRLLSDICDDTDFSSTTDANVDDVDKTSGNWSVVMGFMINVTQPCHEMLLSCKWRNQPMDCDNLFNAALTDEGICCTFNRVRRDLQFRNPRELSDLNITFPYPSADWTPETGYPEQDKVSLLETPWRPLGIGTHLGLTIAVDSEIHDYYCSSTDSAGFKVLLHNPVETPKIAAFGMLIEPGTENRVAITPVISHTASSLRDVSVAKRQCLFQRERYLTFYRTYTQRNCILECEANFTNQHCKCVAHYMPKDKLTRICGKKDEQCANIAREAMELRLANGAANLTHLNITDVPDCQCLPGCSELSYTYSHSSSHFSPTFQPDFDLNLNRNTDYIVKNAAIIHFYFTETLFPSRYKGELFGFTEFLSNSGGILGLFLGFSFLSVVEIAYFLSLRIFCLWSRKQNNVKSKVRARKKLKLDDNDKPVAVINNIQYLQ